MEFNHKQHFLCRQLNLNKFLHRNENMNEAWSRGTNKKNRKLDAFINNNEIIIMSFSPNDVTHMLLKFKFNIAIHYYNYHPIKADFQLHSNAFSNNFVCSSAVAAVAEWSW